MLTIKNRPATRRDGLDGAERRLHYATLAHALRAALLWASLPRLDDAGTPPAQPFTAALLPRFYGVLAEFLRCFYDIFTVSHLYGVPVCQNLKS